MKKTKTRQRKAKGIVLITLFDPTRLMIKDTFDEVQSFSQLFETKKLALFFGNQFRDHAAVVILPIKVLPDVICNFPAVQDIQDKMAIEFIME